jgi:hypothetical protein
MRSKKQQKTQLQIALLGMDERSSKIMSMFFKGPCEGHAVVVDEDQANVAIIDTRFEHSKQLLEQSLAQGKMRAIIVLSSQNHDRVNHDKIIYLDKPISANPMFEALDWAKDISEGKLRKKPAQSQRFQTPKVEEPEPTVTVKTVHPEAIPLAAHIESQAEPEDVPTPELDTPSVAGNHEIPEDLPASPPTVSKPQPVEDATASSMQIEESQFAELIGTVVDIDLDDAARQRYATYDPDKYYQGYVQRAFKQAHDENSVLQLTLGWNPLIIVPHKNQIWWDADDKLLKAVSDIEINAKTVSLVKIAPDELDEDSVTPEKKQDMEAFLWKLTLWSSRGRYPISIDIDGPILLKRWPNFTRQIITPHALRIAALLIKDGPDTMIGIANTLNIELRYVSIFVSAASALDLIRQVAPLKIDEVISPTARKQDAPQKRNIFNKILNKLLGR